MKFPRNSILVLVILFALTTGCIFGTKEYTISGKLVDQDDVAIAGAEIIITGGTSTTATTAGDGTWSARVKGTVTIKPSHEEYAFVPAEATVSQTEDDLNFTGTRLDRYDISGTVLNDKGEPIANSKVVISGQVTKEVEVAANGKWSTSVTGDVNVTAVADGYRFNTVAVTEASTTVSLVGEYIILAHYSMDDTAGTTITDKSANGLNATLVGNLTSVDGVIGKAISLNGTDNHIKMPDGILSELDEVTIATWVRNEEEKYWARIFSFGNVAIPDTTDDGVLFLAAQGSNFTTDEHLAQLKLDFGAYNANVAGFVMGPKLDLNKWYHVAVTISETKASLYVDGKLVGETETSAKPSALGFTAENYIGKSNNRWPDPLLNGSVDDFRIYNTAFTADEITALYQGK